MIIAIVTFWIDVSRKKLYANVNIVVLHAIFLNKDYLHKHSFESNPLYIDQNVLPIEPTHWLGKDLTCLPLKQKKKKEKKEVIPVISQL